MNNLKHIKYTKYIIFIMLPFFILSCQEVYYQDNLHGEKRIPVINGRLTNFTDSIWVNLNRATGLNSNPEFITNADVTIYDEYGKSIKLFEKTGGMYVNINSVWVVDHSVPEFTAKEGTGYFLRVILDDGTIIESDTITMPSSCNIDSVYAEVGKDEVITNDFDGKFRINKKYGIKVKMNISSGQPDKGYYMIKSKVVTQTNPMGFYCFRMSGLSKDLIINSTAFNGKQEVLLNQEYKFLESKISFNDDGTIVSSPLGWIVITEVFSMDRQLYDYCEDVNTQIESENRIFDPIPFQIKGNMKCITDTNMLILGNFEVLSVTFDTIGLFWREGMKDYKFQNKRVVFNESNMGCYDKKPHFWFDFN